MPQDTVTLVKSLYDAFARGDVPSVLGAMDPAIVWNEAEGFVYADRNPYVGPTAIVEGVFARLATEWDGFGLAVEDVFGAGDRVVATGRYRGTYKRTGGAIDAQFAHVWTLRDGRIVRFQQYTDTAQSARATAAAR